MTSPLIVNLLAGPGAGKSTMAAGVFADLKGAGVCAELALEFAKELTWQRRFSALSCQPYVFGEQLWRLESLKDAGVEVIVTDSPLILSTVYGRAWPASFSKAVRDIVRGQRRVNFLVERCKPYDPRGRRGSEESARSVDDAVMKALARAGETFISVTGDLAGRRQVGRAVLAELERDRAA